MNKYRILAGSALALCAVSACSPKTDDLNGAHAVPPAIATSAVLEFDATEADGANMAVLVLNKADQSKSVILGTDETSGVDVYSLDGRKLSNFSAGDAISIDVKYVGQNSANPMTLVTVLDGETHVLNFFSFNSATNTATNISGDSPPATFGTEGMCTLYNPSDQNLYAFVVGGSGQINQNLLFLNKDGKIESKNIRRLNFGSEVGYCVGNDVTGDVYFSEKEVGVWKIAGDPETDAIPKVIDIVKFGNITGEVSGLALQQGNGSSKLIVSNASESSFNVYDVENDHDLIGSFNITQGNNVDAVEEGGGLFASSVALNSEFSEGILIVSDDDNGDEYVNYKAVSLALISQSLKFKNGEALNPFSQKTSSIKTVRASAETDPVSSAGDAADDPAIWIHPTDPSKSTIIGTDKQGGMYVYDLDGNTIQFSQVGRVNNVDIRYGFSLNGKSSPLVTASNRTTKGISIFTVNAQTRKLINIEDGIQDAGMIDPYGQCMYKSAADGKFYVFINDTDGIVRQFVLVESSKGRVSANFVREFSVESQTEGCAADDETGDLFLGEENNAIWKFDAEPNGGDERELVALIDDIPELTADVEGLAIYYKPNGEGYLVASSQGSNDYALFDRKSPHAYIGSFAVVADGETGIDGSSETDGLDVSSANFGPDYPNGIFVAQDGRNVFPSEKQNFKIIDWNDIARTLELQ